VFFALAAIDLLGSGIVYASFPPLFVDTAMEDDPTMTSLEQNQLYFAICVMAMTWGVCGLAAIYSHCAPTKRLIGYFAVFYLTLAAFFCYIAAHHEELGGVHSMEGVLIGTHFAMFILGLIAHVKMPRSVKYMEMN